MKVQALPVALAVAMLAACAPMPQREVVIAGQSSRPAPTPNAAVVTPTQEAVIRAEQADKQSELKQRDRQLDAQREKDLHLKLVQQMMEQNNAFAALAHLDAYDQKWGASRQSRLLRADAYRKTSQWDKAESAYQTLLGNSTSAQSGPVWYGLGKVSIEKGDLKSANTRLEKAVQIDPLNVSAYTDLGLVYLLEGLKDPAYNALMKASQLSGGDTTVKANLALWALVFDEFGLAKDMADQLNWSEVTRNKVLAQANVIKKRIDSKGGAR
nr:tetratricopeptide repeat protein [Limnobacter humi]